MPASKALDAISGELEGSVYVPLRGRPLALRLLAVLCGLLDSDDSNPKLHGKNCK